MGTCKLKPQWDVTKYQKKNKKQKTKTNTKTNNLNEYLANPICNYFNLTEIWGWDSSMDQVIYSFHSAQSHPTKTKAVVEVFANRCQTRKAITRSFSLSSPGLFFLHSPFLYSKNFLTWPPQDNFKAVFLIDKTKH